VYSAQNWTQTRLWLLFNVKYFSYILEGKNKFRFCYQVTMWYWNTTMNGCFDSHTWQATRNHGQGRLIKPGNGYRRRLSKMLHVEFDNPRALQPPNSWYPFTFRTFASCVFGWSGTTTGHNLLGYCTSNRGNYSLGDNLYGCLLLFVVQHDNHFILTITEILLKLALNTNQSNLSPFLLYTCQ
jgi:hypothetical protein